MAGDVIKSYLVALGFSVDGKTQQAFNRAVAGATANVAGLGKTVVGTAATFVGSMELMASKFEKLYFESRLTGATAEGLQEIAFGAESIGLSSAQAIANFEKFALKLKFDPTAKGFLGALGVTGKTTEELYHNFLRFEQDMARIAPNVAASYAQMFGMDERTLALELAGLNEQDRNAARLGEIHRKVGFNADEAARKGHELAQQWRDIWAEIGSVAGREFNRMEPTLHKWLDEAKDGIIVAGEWLKRAQEMAEAQERRPGGGGVQTGQRALPESMDDWTRQTMTDIGRFSLVDMLADVGTLELVGLSNLNRYLTTLQTPAQVPSYLLRDQASQQSLTPGPVTVLVYVDGKPVSAHAETIRDLGGFAVPQ